MVPFIILSVSLVVVHSLTSVSVYRIITEDIDMPCRALLLYFQYLIFLGVVIIVQIALLIVFFGGFVSTNVT